MIVELDLKEILLNGKGGLLFKVGDYNKLSKLILFYNSNKKYHSMLNKSVKALNRFDYFSNLKKYLEIIESSLIILRFLKTIREI